MSTLSKGFAQWLCRTPRWGLPLFSLVLGAKLAGAPALGGQPGGWWVLALFTA